MSSFMKRSSPIIVLQRALFCNGRLPNHDKYVDSKNHYVQLCVIFSDQI